MEYPTTFTPDDLTPTREYLKSLLPQLSPSRILSSNRHLDTLATLIYYAEQQGLKLEELTLVEFGAGPHYFRNPYDSLPYCGVISHAMALNSDRLPFTYRWHDKLEPLAREIREQRRERREGKIESYSHYVENLTPFSIRLAELYLSFRKIKKLAASQRIVIFSDCTLSDPDLNHQTDFWHLPGIHIHFGSPEELPKTEQDFSSKFGIKTLTRKGRAVNDEGIFYCWTI